MHALLYYQKDFIKEYFNTGRDDVGSTNIEAVCKSGAKLLHRPMPQWINDRGEWGHWVNCPPEAPSVCGIKSRIDNGSPNRYFVILIQSRIRKSEIL
jgi:hypothetical protein